MYTPGLDKGVDRRLRLGVGDDTVATRQLVKGQAAVKVTAEADGPTASCATGANGNRPTGRAKEGVQGCTTHRRLNVEA
jgi:hypothetical protein